MCIATSALPNVSLRWERNRAAEPSLGSAKAIALLWSFGLRKDLQAINISPLWGEATTMFCCTSNLNSPFSVSRVQRVNPTCATG
jgi:hypothetical protein